MENYKHNKLLSSDCASSIGGTAGSAFHRAPVVASLLSAILTCVLTSGCGNGTSSQDATSNDSHLKFVADSYSLFLKGNRRLPKDDVELREFVAKLAADDPQVQGQTIERLLTSPRDGKPYGLFTSENPPPAGGFQAVYEQEGVNGQRLVADTAGNIQEIDEATFRTMRPNSP